jgi:glucose-6-phosphate isomerase
MTCDITVLHPGMIGQEYSKTYGHYHVGEGTEVYKILSGTSLLLIQKPNFNFEEVEAVRFIKLTAGQSFETPSGWGHTLINISNTPVIMLDHRIPSVDHLYSVFAKKKGPAYYVIEKDGQMKLEANSNYGQVPKPQSF